MAEVVVVHGYPGSGRTTHSKRVAAEGLEGRPVRHVSIGDQLRAIRSREITSSFSDYIHASDTPAHLPDTVVNSVALEALGTPSADELLIIDGYPRFPSAICAFRDSLIAHNYTLLGVISLTISLDTSLDRVLARGRRTDDATSDDVWKSAIVFEYNRHAHTTDIALLGFSAISAVALLDASGDQATVYANFTAALSRLTRHE